VPPRPATVLAKVRKTALALPEASERLSHGAPAWFVGTGRKQRCFAMFADDHHGDGRLAIWCAATREAQAMLVDDDPDVYFVPPYVGPSGWIGVRLDRRAPWAAVAHVLARAHAQARR